MGYRVRIGRLEVECESVEELDVLVERYGSAEPVAKVTTTPGSLPSGNGAAPRDRDQALLRQLVQSPSGLDAGTVSTLLGGARGRAVPVAVRRWAERVGLSDEGGADALVSARVAGGARGWRLTPGALNAARAMLEGQG